MNKCHNCKGKGINKCSNPNIKGVCYYCNGTGLRNKKYKRNKNENVYK